MNKRILWVDSAKGIGAILVILGHFLLLEAPKIFIYAFHMPLFFFLSGVTFNVQARTKLTDFVRNKFRTIMIPYYIFSLLLYFYYLINDIKNGKDIAGALKRFIGIFICWKETELYNGIWFLPCMFCVFLLGYVICKYVWKKLILALVSLIVLFTGYMFSKYHIVLPLGADTAMIAFFFFAMGYLFKDKQQMIRYHYILLYIPMIAFTYLNYKLSGCRIEMYSNDYGYFLLFLLEGSFGIFATLGMAKFIKDISFINNMGKESLYLYGAQTIMLALLYNEIIPRFHLEHYSLVVKSILGFIFSVAVFVILWFLKPIYYKLLHFLEKYIC